MAERVRCPGCGHTCCPYPRLECGGESDVVTSSTCDDCDDLEAASTGEGDRG